MRYTAEVEATVWLIIVLVPGSKYCFVPRSIEDDLLMVFTPCVRLVWSLNSKSFWEA